MAFWAALNASQFINTCHLADAFHLDVIFEHPAICANKHKTCKHFLKGTVHSKIVIIYSPSFSKPVWLLLIFNCSKNEWGLEFSSLKKGMQKRYKTFIKIVHMTCYLINICSLYTRLVNKSFFGVASVQLICLVHKSFTDSFTDSVLEFNSLNQWLGCGSSWAELTGGEDYRWIIFILGVNYSFKSLTQLPIAGLYPFSSIWIRVKQSSVQVCSWFSPHSTTNPRPSAPISDVRQEQMEVLSALHVSAVVRKCVCYSNNAVDAKTHIFLASERWFAVRCGVTDFHSVVKHWLWSCIECFWFIFLAPSKYAI